MTQHMNTPDNSLETGPVEPTATAEMPPTPQEDETIDRLIDDLEAVATEARRVPFGHKILVDEDEILDLVDRLRVAVPTEVRQAQRIMEEQERILEQARAEAHQMLESQGLMRELENERQQMLNEVHREAEEVRADADDYAHRVLLDLQERLYKLQNSVQNGIDALRGSQDQKS
jgi:hypothetical protein